MRVHILVEGLQIRKQTFKVAQYLSEELARVLLMVQILFLHSMHDARPYGRFIRTHRREDWRMRGARGGETLFSFLRT